MFVLFFFSLFPQSFRTLRVRILYVCMYVKGANSRVALAFMQATNLYVNYIELLKFDVEITGALSSGLFLSGLC